MINYDTKDLIHALTAEHEATTKRANVIKQTVEILQMVDTLKEFDRHSEAFHASLEWLLGVEKNG